jgi:hypothetical protein
MVEKSKISSALLKGPISWAARMMALSAVLVLGKAEQAQAVRVDVGDENFQIGEIAEGENQVSYVQVGDLSEWEPGNPPRTE